METLRVRGQFIELKNLKELREIAGLTQQELSHLVQIAHGTVRAIETGHKGYSDLLVRRISERLGCGMTERGKEQPAELTLTKIDSDEPYTREWFTLWNEICLRKQAYAGFLNSYIRLLSDVVQAACELDIEHEKEGTDLKFERSDHLARKLSDSLQGLLGDRDLCEKFIAVGERGVRGPKRLRGGCYDVTGVLGDKLVDGRQKYEHMVKLGKRMKKETDQ